MELFVIFIGAALVNNFVLARFLGICPFLGVSRRLETAFGMGMSVIFVMTLASVGTNIVYTYVLVPLGLEFLQIIAFILIIASLVQLVETVLQKTVPTLYKGLGIYLPLITTNCAILGLAFLNVLKSYDLLRAIIFGLGAGMGFTLALLLMAGIREKLVFADVPKSLKGAPIALIVAGLMSLAFFGFSGLVRM
ncbi:MAG: electron transport complex subunit RsxA [bacterium]